MLEPEVLQGLPTPCFLADEGEVKKNLATLAKVKADADCKILLALKAFAMWRLAPLCMEYLDGVNCASLNEALLGLHEFGREVHLTAPAYIKADLERLLLDVSAHADQRLLHITFNSLSQWRAHGRDCLDQGVICGLRVNPEKSTTEKPIYDPCRPGSRLGIIASELDAADPAELEGITGLHFHALCEQNSTDLEVVLAAFEEKFGRHLDRMKWVNFGGGHHITRRRALHPELGIGEDYDLDRLVRLIREFKSRHPLEVYLEPGEAVGLGAGIFVTTVLDIIERDVPIAILDCSVSTHLPDVIEGPYLPPVLGARAVEPGCDDYPPNTLRLAGLSCLAGDEVGEYVFEEPLTVGSRVVFLDQAHYTMVKTNTFNGINLPAIALRRLNGRVEILKEFGYEDFKDRLS